MITLYDADRCPYCARVRIALAEKGIEYETVEIDLDDRPAWIYEKNPLGRVPVLEEDTFVLAESAVIDEYLEGRYPDPPLWPADPAAGRVPARQTDVGASACADRRARGDCAPAVRPWTDDGRVGRFDRRRDAGRPRSRRSVDGRLLRAGTGAPRARAGAWFVAR